MQFELLSPKSSFSFVKMEQKDLHSFLNTLLISRFYLLMRQQISTMLIWEELGKVWSKDN